ncbi:hypothetical protein JNE17039_45520 (plasmid) [Escherichia coli]
MHRPIEINSQEITEVVFLQQIYTNGMFTCKMLVDGGIRYRNKLTVSAVYRIYPTATSWLWRENSLIYR